MKLAACSRHNPLTNSKYQRKFFVQAAEYINQQNESLDPNPGAYHLLDEMRKRDVASETALIRHLVKQNLHKDAFLWFANILHLNIRPNEHIFGALIHSSVPLKYLHLGKQIQGFSVKVGLDSNVYVGSAIVDLYVKLGSIEDAQRAFLDTHRPNVVSYTTLIRGYIKQGRFDEAVEIFQSMPERNEVSWNTMISGCSQTGRNEEAVNFFVEMLRVGELPTQFTYPCAVIAAANMGSLGMGRSIHACAVKFLDKFSLFLANSLISFYAKCGSMEDSLLVFNRILEKNVVSWNALICGYAQNGQGNDAIEIFMKMKLMGFQPNSVTLLCLLLACDHVGLVDKGYEYFKEAKDDPSLIKAEHYACMIDLLSRSGRFQEAEIFLHDLPFDPGTGFWKALLGGCQIHSNLKLGEVAARKILELETGDVSSYVMLSNAHSAAGRWHSVVKIRQEMREKGLNRIPGSSWVDIKSKIQVFVTGDTRHDCKDEIYMCLGIFLEHAMDWHESSLVP
ncbi:pentatricopeptide repeat-containing protein mitochondrial-like [Dorcoceras hygrometricum]|uniref:Pentatricopeptide repeat-containing protein mitochondrial-like n=1 Tax=Dorcoceras hygrometricum TaxID=472368 RepID=A0A2Z7CXI5_9LAMI|nr:pentatricopeptide repeat-containing protein mitochondrial-like [Dorcoceras hygrometricum]